MGVLKFVKENQESIIEKLNNKGFLLENKNFDIIRTGVREVLLEDNTCDVVTDESKVSIEGKQELINHFLKDRWVSISFSFKKKRYKLKLKNIDLYYSYCVL